LHSVKWTIHFPGLAQNWPQSAGINDPKGHAANVAA
jgi:hypothetical protein